MKSKLIGLPSEDLYFYFFPHSWQIRKPFSIWSLSSNYFPNLTAYTQHFRSSWSEPYLGSAVINEPGGRSLTNSLGSVVAHRTTKFERSRFQSVACGGLGFVSFSYTRGKWRTSSFNPGYCMFIFRSILWNKYLITCTSESYSYSLPVKRSVNPLTPTNAHDRIPRYTIDAMSSREVIKNKEGVISWSDTKFSALTLKEMYGRQ